MICFCRRGQVISAEVICPDCEEDAQVVARLVLRCVEERGRRLELVNRMTREDYWRGVIGDMRWQLRVMEAMYP